MRGLQVVGGLLVVLGLLYTVVYVGWLRRSPKRASTAAPSSGVDFGPPAAQTAPWVRRHASEAPLALVLAWVQGTYLGTTMASSRHDRATAAKLAVRAAATMVVDDSVVRWERDDAVAITVSGPRLLGVSLERDPSGRAMGRTQIVRVAWQADNGDHQATTFLPRVRAESAALVSAVERLMKIAPIQDPPLQAEPVPQDRVNVWTTRPNGIL